MTDNLENQLAEVVKLAKDSSINAADFIQKQFPDFARELLSYHHFYYMLAFIISITCFLGLIICMKSVFQTFRAADTAQKELDKSRWSDEMCCKFAVNIILSIIFLIIGLIEFNIQWVKIQMAPKVYLTEYIKDRLIK